jgi:hypothetical protein
VGDQKRRVGMAVGRELSLKNGRLSKVKILSPKRSRKTHIAQPLSVKHDRSWLWVDPRVEIRVRVWDPSEAEQ